MSLRTQIGLSMAALLVIAAILGGTMYNIRNAMERLDFERSSSTQFLIKWLTLDDLATQVYIHYQPNRSSELIPRDLIDRLSQCDREFHSMMDSKTLAAFTMTGKYPVKRISELKDLWEIIYRYFRPHESQSYYPDLYPPPMDPLDLATKAVEFKRAMVDHIGRVEKLSTEQQQAMADFSVSCLLAAIILVFIGTYLYYRVASIRTSQKQSDQQLAAILTAQEQERIHLAMELHDSVAQELAAANMISHQIADGQRELRATLTGLLDASIENLRNLSNEMFPPDLSHLGLANALESLVRKHQERNPGTYTYKHQTVDSQISVVPELGIHIYRTAQEALNNIEKHARASIVNVILHYDRENISLTITDNGVGIGPRPVRKPEKSFGLANMQKRAALLGGNLHVQTAPGKGTTIILEVPYGRSNQPAPRR